MPDAASRWAILASLTLHVGALSLTLGKVPRAPTQKATLADFWAGTTFEVPEHIGDLAWESPASEAFETTSEINVEGLDLSGPSRSVSEPAPAPTTVVKPAVTPSTSMATDDTTHPAMSPASHAKGKASARHPRVDTRAAAAASAAAGSTGSSGSASSGTFGAEGAAAGVRDLVRSFVRAIPIVASSDPGWASLPLGAAGSAEVTLGLDAEGKPFAAQPLESAAPAHLRRLVHKTLTVMSGGRFGVPPSGAPAAEQKLRIAIILTQQDPPADRDVATGGAFSLRFEPADAHHVSRAFFTLASGRRVEVSVRQLSAR
jgi:hypothetical protein